MFWNITTCSIKILSHNIATFEFPNELFGLRGLKNPLGMQMNYGSQSQHDGFSSRKLQHLVHLWFFWSRKANVHQPMQTDLQHDTGLCLPAYAPCVKEVHKAEGRHPSL
jgi:hypothetical protein